MYSNDQLCEAYRAAMKSAADMMHASLGGFQRLQNCQLEATQQILSAQTEAVKELDAATSIHDLVEIGAQLGWLQYDKFMSCWGSLYAHFGINQMEFIRQAQTKSMEAIDEMGRMLDDVPAAPGTEQVVSALRLAVSTTRSSYEAGVRAIEEAEREAAARLGSTEQSERTESRGRKVRAAA